MGKLTSIVFAGALAVSALSAKAMPVAGAATPAGENAMITKVIQGCGPNGHRGPFGACLPRYVCPRGWHPGPAGWHCFRN